MEKTIDYNQKVREITKSIYNSMKNYTKETYGGFYTRFIDSIFLRSLNKTNEISAQLYNILNISEQDIYASIAISTMFQYQMFIDYYKKLNLEEKIEKISTLETQELEILRNSTTPETIVECAKKLDSDMPYNMLQTMFQFSSLSVFEKILQIKALSDIDVDKLTSISPFFIIEKNKYDISISLSFIKDRINKLNNGALKDDTDRTYNETINFIFDLNKIRKEETISLLDEIIVESSDTEIKQTKDEEESIQCSYGYVSKDKLKSILINMTKINDIPVKEKK